MAKDIKDFIKHQIPSAPQSHYDFLEWYTQFKSSIRTYIQRNSTSTFKRWESDLSDAYQSLWAITDAISSLTSIDIDPSSQESRLFQEREQLLETIHNIEDLIQTSKTISLGTKIQHYRERPNPTLTKTLHRRTKPRSANLIVELSNNSQTFTNIKDMLHHARSFYSNLYAPPTTSPDHQETFLKAMKIRVPPELYQSLSAPFTDDEILSGINNLQNNKAPGRDGLPHEFLKSFATELLPLFRRFCDACHSSLSQPKSTNTQIFPSTFSQSNIIIIHKKGDRNDLNNYRPISLLNSDYKLFSSIAAKRVQPTLHYLIHPDQTGFVPGRQISNNIFAFLDLVHHSHLNEQAGAVIFGDLYKAYDKIDRNFIFKCLKQYGFPPLIYNLFSALHHKAQGRILINNFPSHPFDIHSGVRQGCLWAPQLFILAHEFLANYCRLHMRGYPLPTTPRSPYFQKVVLSIFADDTTWYITSITELRRLLQILKEYHRASNNSVNPTKTYILPLGSFNTEEMRATISSFCPFTIWESSLNPIQLLGFPVGHAILLDLIWTKPLNTFISYSNITKQLALSIFDPVSVMSTFFLTKCYSFATH